MVQVGVSNASVVLGGVVFCHVVRAVEEAFAPDDIKLVLFDAVANPIEPHVDCLGPLLFDSVVGYARGGGVISNDRGGRLGMSQFFETDPDGARFLGIVEDGSKFAFGSRGDNFFQGLAWDVDGTIWTSAEGRGVGFTQEMKPSPARPSFRLR